MLPRAVAPVLAALVLSGCALPLPWGGPDDATPPTSSTPTITPPDIGPPLVFGGVVLDVLSGKPIEGAAARLDLAQVRPCRREAIVWNAWETTTDAAGRFEHDAVARPRSNDVAFWIHVQADGYAEGIRHIGPADVPPRGDSGNLTFKLHPSAVVNGTAPPATVLALADRDFPRFAVADANGTFAFPDAHVTPSAFVAALDVPSVETLSAPVTLDLAPSNAAGWRLEGRLVAESGAPVAGDVVAWNGTRLVSAARAGDAGVFVLPLHAQQVGLRIEARTSDGSQGASLVLDVQGPPATRQTLIMRALC